MKNIPAKNIQRITLIIAMLFGLNLTTTAVFAQDAEASVKNSIAVRSSLCS